MICFVVIPTVLLSDVLLKSLKFVYFTLNMLHGDKLFNITNLQLLLVWHEVDMTSARLHNQSSNIQQGHYHKMFLRNSKYYLRDVTFKVDLYIVIQSRLGKNTNAITCCQIFAVKFILVFLKTNFLTTK